MTNGTTNKFWSFVANWWYLVAIGLIIFLLATFFAGQSCGDSRAASKYRKQLEETMKKSAEHEAKAKEALKNEAVLAERNEILKEKAEAQAKLLEESNSKELEKAAENLKEIASKKEAKLTEIANTKDEDQKCKMCREARAIGLELKQCKGVCE